MTDDFTGSAHWPSKQLGVCRYTVTGKCCVFNWVDGKLVQACPPDWCAPPPYGRVKAPKDWWTKLWGTKGQ